MREVEATIEVYGAKENNLQDVDLSIPKHRLVVFTGPSGSGKSSLAFHTLYAEGRRRYIESLSTYARQFLGDLDKPDYDRITGLCPTISIDQKTGVYNPRSTVGTVTEIYDHMRVLYAKLGVELRAEADGVVETLDILAEILELPKKTRFMLLAPLVENRKGLHKDLFVSLRKAGFVRVRVDGEIRLLEDLESVELQKRHTIEVVIDRLVAHDTDRDRLGESVDRALLAGDGRCLVVVPPQAQHQLGWEKVFRQAEAQDFSHQHFSFNSPLGQCRTCGGMGTRFQVRATALLGETTLTIRDGALAVLGREEPSKNFVAAQDVKPVWQELHSMAEAGHVDLDVPWVHLSESTQQRVLRGNQKQGYVGVLTWVERALEKARKQSAYDYFEQFHEPTLCRDCQGARLNEWARSLRFQSRTIVDLCRLDLEELLAFLSSVELEADEALIGGPLVEEIIVRLRFLVQVGLGYLNLHRGASTLSGGESQRIRLARQLGSELSGVLYVLDEPSIGLHSRDHHQLIEALERIRDRGNSVLVVEHDRETIERADYIVDFGPGGGRKGGRVIAVGTPAEIARNPDSETGAFLSHRRKIQVPSARRPGEGVLSVVGARQNNLQAVDVHIPIGAFVCVTGVSGAGKSTLVHEIIYPAVARHVYFRHRVVGDVDGLEGLDHFDKVISIDQKPLGRSARSNPATYTKVFDHIRAVFAMLPEAKVHGYQASRFSFNVAQGRCDHCKGSGTLKFEMNFLSNVYVQCEVCQGRRFNPATLMVTYRGKTIADVLAMTVDEASQFFEHHPKVARVLRTLLDVGLDYVQLGQPSRSLSGGEAQRVKLSRELAKIATGRTLYILDEPTTGLHFADIEKLLRVVSKLVDAGNTVLTIEHNLDFIQAADHIIDLGPNGGSDGGHVIASGTPEEVARVAKSHTGRYLRQALGESPPEGAPGRTST
jgi:excinuclease ABC subunit A